MKILKVACEQFAGIRDFEVEFKDGINIVFGANESGKSSLVNILAETLLKDPKLSKNNNTDKIFINSFFPCEVRNDDDAMQSVQSGNFIDGSVTFETRSGVFKLNKKWRNDGKRCEINLIQPNGDKLDNEIDIKNLLYTELQHGDGVFREILLSQQTVNIESLRKLIQHSNDFQSGGEIINFLTKLYAETGSDISILELENKINKKIYELGNNWDNQRGVITNRRFKSEISEAFNALNEIRANLEKIKIHEDTLITSEKKFKAASSAALIAEERFIKFQDCAVYIEQSQSLEKEIKHLNENLKNYNAALQEWPRFDEMLRKAVRLSRELNQVKFMALVNNEKNLQDRINKLNIELEDMPSSEQIERDIAAAESAYDIIKICMDNLKGVNLKLEAKVNGNYKFGVIMPSRDNAVLTPSNINNLNNHRIFEYNIDRAVIVKIPEVAEINISKAGVNADEAKSEWERNKIIIREIIARYKIELGEDRSIAALRRKLKELERNYEIKLKEKQSLEHEKTDVRKKIKENINNAVNSKTQDDDNYHAELLRDEAAVINEIKLLGATPEKIDVFIERLNVKIGNYKENYETFDNLKALISQAKTELDEASKKFDEAKVNLKNVPDEYKIKIDVKLIKSGLEEDFKKSRDDRDNALNALNDARNDLDYLQKQYGGSAKLELDYQQAEREFNDKRIEFAHWNNILKIFNKTKEELNKNPVDYLIEKFSHYLDIISGGRLESENDNSSSALMPEIYSLDRNSKYRKLGWLNISEGTKETIAFAFRLAVIDQLYQDGGAVVVLDDPLVNMDAERSAQACKIIKEFAEKNKNQVIFLTCRREYQDSLDGNFIELKNI